MKAVTVRSSDAQLRDIVRLGASAIHGRGVFAARDISQGEYIGTFAGAQVENDGVYVLWAYATADDIQPVGRRGRNMLRFLNHCDPCNAAFDGLDLFARRAIPLGREVTIDYGGDADDGVD